MPVVQIELDFQPGNKAEEFDLVIKPAIKELDQFKSATYSGAGNGGMLVALNSNDAQWTGDELVQHISLKPGKNLTLKPLLVYYDPDWVTTNDYASGNEIAEHVYAVWDDLKAKTEAFGCYPGNR